MSNDSRLRIDAGGSLTLSGDMEIGVGAVRTELDLNGGSLIKTGGTDWVDAGSWLTLRNGAQLDVSNNGDGGLLGLRGGTLYIGDGGGTVDATAVYAAANSTGDVIFNNTIGNTDFAPDIRGNISVTQNGTGITTLLGSNSYTGDTVVTNGTLRAGTTDAFVDNIIYVVHGGTLDLNGFDLTMSVLSGSGGTVALGAADLTINTSITNNPSYAGVISGTGSLTKSGGGTLRLSGANSYSGGTTVNGGTLRAMAAGAFVNNAAYTVNGGTLDLGGYDLTMSSLSGTGGTVAIGAASLTIDQSTNTSFAGALTGNRLINKIGTGTLALSGDSSAFSGTTQIANGQLVVTGPLGGGKIVTQNGVLTAAAANVFAGTNIQLRDTGRLNVAADNALANASIDFGNSGVPGPAGTLALNGRSTAVHSIGSSAVGGGSIVNGGASDSMLTVNGSGTFHFAGVMADGAGGGRLGLTMEAGELLLGWYTANTYTGGTTVNGGILAANTAFGFVQNSAYTVNGGTLDLNGFDLTMSSLSGVGGTVALGAANLTANQAANSSFAGVLSGTGAFTKSGSGALTLTGDSSAFAGATTVGSGGALVVGVGGSGALGGAMTIGSGARLGGTGTIGSAGSTLTIAAGGAHAPGNSIGVQTIAGNYANHGTLTIEATPTAADRIVVAGSVDITGASLDLILSPADASSWGVFNGPFTIIDKQSAGAVAGTFGSVTKNLLFLDTVLDYAGGDGNDVTLQLERNNVTFAAVGQTRNQIATGTAAETLGNGSAVWRAIALTNDPDLVRLGFDALSGEIHASAKSVMIEDSRFLRSATNDRLRAAFGGVGASNGNVVTYVDGKPVPVAATIDGLAVWGQGFGAWGNINGDGNAASVSRSTGGFFVGADAPVFDTWRFGAVAGYSRSSFDVKDRSSTGSSDNYHLGLYGGTQWGDLSFRTGAAYTWHDVTMNRTVSFAGFGDSLKGGYNAGTAQVYGELGYKVQVGSVAFEPFANLAYVNLNTSGFTEQGGAAALFSASSNMDASFTTLGLRGSATFDVNGASLTAKGMIGWRHAFGDTVPLSGMQFASGGAPFTIAGVPIARDAAVVEAGLDYAISPNATLGIAYGGQFGSGVTDQSVRANLSVRF